MTSSRAVESFEIERKYHVTDDAVIPSASAFHAIGLVLGEMQVHHLDAEYFDTPSLDLGAQRFAVRRRRGGKDAGWHLKEKGEGGVRELAWPIADRMPPQLQSMIRDRVGTQSFEELDTIAMLQTDRRVTSVSNADCVELAEIVDDRVDAHNVLRHARESWREWEVELAPSADPAILDLIETLLEAAGAVRLRGTSKIQRTMQLGS